MTASRFSRLAVMAATMVVLAAQVWAQNTANAVQEKQAIEAATPQREIVVSLEDRKLALVEDGRVLKEYPVAVGKPSTPSPVGTFTIERRVANPIYQHDGRTVEPGPHNPVGTRWMGLSIRGYGIHGTNVPSSIGKAASHGCIRMARRDVEELFSLVQVGDKVELIGQRNEETAQLFGDGPKPDITAIEQPTELAKNEPAATAPAQPQTDSANATAKAATTSVAAAVVSGTW
jgi:L,D-transpeptidase catalytic domain